MTLRHIISDYKLIRSKRKTLGLQITGDGLIARAPIKMSIACVEKFIVKKQNWINKHLKNITNNTKKLSFNTGDKFLYLGVEYSLIVKNCELFFDGKNFIGNGSKVEFLNFYKQSFAKVLSERLPKIANENNFKYNQVRIKTQKTRWGSCSFVNNLNFNYLLIMTPIQTIDSVIIHELAHTIHKNHGADFWNLVLKIMPSYKKNQEFLKANNHQINLFLPE
jgi:predicted metal-dependent hydrolase